MAYYLALYDSEEGFLWWDIIDSLNCTNVFNQNKCLFFLNQFGN